MLDYGDGNESWLSRISPDEDVVICDFGFQHKTEDMKKLLEVTKNVIWIDHHESTINDYGEMEKEISWSYIIHFLSPCTETMAEYILAFYNNPVFPFQAHL